MNRRRGGRGETVCDSVLCSLAVVISLTLSIVYYRHDLRQLLRLFFLFAVLIGAFLTFRHSLTNIRRRIVKWRRRGKKDDRETTPEVRPDLDRERDEALAKAQHLHDLKAVDYETRIAGPRRERKMEEEEKKMRYFKGFGQDEGQVLGGGDPGSKVNDPRSRDSHVTEDDVISEGDQSGKRVWVAVQLPDRMIRRQFHNTQTMKVVYDWLRREGQRSKDHALIMPHSRQLLDDRSHSLQDYGITMDTKLILEELED